MRMSGLWKGFLGLRSIFLTGEGDGGGTWAEGLCCWCAERKRGGLKGFWFGED